MDIILNYIGELSNIKIMDIIFAIVIIILFRISSSAIAYIIVKMFKPEVKNKKKIRESAVYNPIRIFICMIGVYLSILILKEPFKISNYIMGKITVIFKILGVIIFAKGLAASFLPKSTLVKRMRERTTQDVEDSMFEFLLKIIRIVIYFVAGFLIITFLGINLNGLIAGLGLSGVILTLAAQDTAKNLFGGLVIFLDKPFVVGDWIEMKPYEGTVEDITFRSTRIRTFENSLLNVPNSIISDSSIINWSKMEKRRYRTHIWIQSNTPIEKIEIFMARVREMLQQRDAIFDETILVKFEEITSNGLSILISSFTDSVDYSSYLSEVQNINNKIMRILREENIELAHDIKTVYIKE